MINAMVDPGHRMSRRVEGDADSLRALTSEALLELHSSVVGPDRATLIVVGDLSTVDVRPWQSGPSAAGRRGRGSRRRTPPRCHARRRG
ncbi:hypothetical protein ACFQ9X_33295 [Catenulispora yoronensis]